MTFEFRIDDARDLENGEFEVAYTQGQSPLPVAPSGLSIAFASRQAFVEKLAEVTGSMPTDVLVSMAAAATVKANPGMTNLASFRGRFVRLDFDGSERAIQVG